MEYPNKTPDSKSERAKKQLEGYVKDDYKIFIDTCSLLYDAADVFWQNIIPVLHQYSSKVIIPMRCGQELEKHARNTSDADLAQKANHALKTINQLIGSGFVEVRGESTDNFADNVFLTVFTKFRISEKLLLITQDRGLATDILDLNNSKSVRGNTIHVKKISKYGYLGEVFPKDGSPTMPFNTDQKQEAKPPKMIHKERVFVPENEKFEICNKITDIPDTCTNVSYVPKAGDEVYAYTSQCQWVPITLKSELGAGGEASIYTTDAPVPAVAKIYKKETNTKRKQEKIKRMIEKGLECEGICFPAAAVYNKNKEFVGFLMPPAKGKELQRGIFLVKQIFLKNFPNWKKRDTVELCITILEKIKYLHDRNVIMGDINPANILVVSPKEVYFVDTDSYQIEDLPCPVGTINYTAPEIQRKHFGDFLRTKGNENFAVATLMFMIMLPGKPPYSQQGGENPIENIEKMNFSYPFGENSNKKTPDGPWRYIWSHLTRDMKEAFYTTFRYGEAHSTENTRLSVDEWISLFRYYLDLLDSGKYGNQDAMSEELYPDRFKKIDKFTYIRCSLCGVEKPEEHCQGGICRSCLNDGETYKCSRCGKEITYTNYHKYIKKSRKYENCKECFDWLQAVGTTVRCSDCGRSFDVTNGDIEFYRQKFGSLPKRCKSCRDAKKQRDSAGYSNNSAGAGNRYSQPTYTPKPTTPPAPPKNKGSFCFITTAVCEYFGKPDNCYELTTLRNYRDNWLRKQPGGKDLVMEYYNSAPLIVAKLKQSEYYADYCEHLMDKYIQPCISLIEASEYDKCKNLYVSMVHYLKSELK